MTRRNIDPTTFIQMYSRLKGNSLRVGLKVPSVDIIIINQGVLKDVCLTDDGKASFLLQTRDGVRSEDFFQSDMYNVELVDSSCLRLRWPLYDDDGFYIEITLEQGSYPRSLGRLQLIS